MYLKIQCSGFWDWLSLCFLIAIAGIIVAILYYKRSVIKEALFRKGISIWNYFLNFGWLVIVYVLIILAISKLFPQATYWIVLSSLLLLFILFPMKSIYSLVGGKSSLRAFFILFLLTQVIFSLVYHGQIMDDDQKGERVTVNARGSDNPVESIVKEGNNRTAEPWTDVFLKTLYTGLTLDGSLFMPENDEAPGNYGGLNNVYALVITQIFISWIYLGVLIASLYQKIRNE